MSDTKNPNEGTGPENPFEGDSNPLFLTDEAKNTTGSGQSVSPGAASDNEAATPPGQPETAETETKPEAAPVGDTWEEPQVTAAPQESNNTTILVLGIIFTLAGVIVFLCLQNHSLRKKTEELDSQLSQSREIIQSSESQTKRLLAQSQARNAELEKQLNRVSKAVGAGLQPVGAKSEELRIISAVYGSGQNFGDVTDRVCELLGRPDYEVYAKPEWLKIDPTPGWNKQLVIIYEYLGTRRIHLAGEGGHVSVAKLQNPAR